MGEKTSEKPNEIRVLHIKDQLSADGATVIILNLARQLQGRVTFDWLLFQEGSGQWHESFERLGGTIHTLHRHKDSPKIRRWVKNYFTAKEFFRTHPYHTIHIDTDGFGRIIVLLAAKNAGIEQRIVHSHSSRAEGSGLFRNPGLQYIGRKLYKALATDYVACSELAGRWLFPQNVQNRVQLLNNGIDTERFRFDAQKRNACRKELNIKNEFLVGHVGRFAEVKNHSFLIEVFQKIHQKKPESRLLLIGSGTLKSEIRQKIEMLALSSAVIIIDETDCPERYYCAMDVFLLPSMFEGLSVSAVEAQCSGLPSFISSNCSEETVITKDCYRLSLESGAEAWCERILAEKQTLPEMRSTTYQIVKEQGYDIREAAEQLFELYQKPYRN